jgi:hypothetical protein
VTDDEADEQPPGIAEQQQTEQAPTIFPVMRARSNC